VDGNITTRASKTRATKLGIDFPTISRDALKNVKKAGPQVTVKIFRDATDRSYEIKESLS
jgi:hypothetical protein